MENLEGIKSRTEYKKTLNGITHQLESCLKKIISNGFDNRIVSKTYIGVTGNLPSRLKTKDVTEYKRAEEKIQLFELCRLMEEKGFYIASFIPSKMNVLSDFNKKSPYLDSDKYGKPTESIYFSHLENKDGSVAPGWFFWLNDDQRGVTQKIPLYINADILFAKADPSKIQEVSQISKTRDQDTISRMEIQGWKLTEKQKERFDFPDYANLPEKIDGIHTTVNDAETEHIWAVETTAVWNIRCLTDMMYFRGVGNWTYEKTPILERSNQGITQVCKNMKRKKYTYAAFVPKELQYDAGTPIDVYVSTSNKPTSDTNGKPTHSIFFTRIVKMSGYPNSDPEFCPDLYNWLTSNPNLTAEMKSTAHYSTCDILFANVDEMKVFDAKQEDIPMKITNDEASFQDHIEGAARNWARAFKRMPDYQRISENYDGIEIDGTDKKYNKEWGVKTLAVWDFKCISDICYYSNNGKWSYNKKKTFEYTRPESDDEEYSE